MTANKRILLILFVCFLALGLLIYFVAGAPEKTDTEKLKPVNWVENYDIEEKSPYGLHIFSEVVYHYYERLGNKPVKVSDYNEKDNEHYVYPAVYFEVKKYINDPVEEQHNLLNFVEQGNYAFLSAEYYPDLVDEIIQHHYRFEQKTYRKIELKFTESKWTTGNLFPFEFFYDAEVVLHDWQLLKQKEVAPPAPVVYDSISAEEDSITEDAYYSDTLFDADEVEVSEDVPEYEEENEDVDYDYDSGFNKKLIGKTKVLETTKGGFPVFVRIKYGEGILFIHTIPLVFTNISMLKEKNVEHLEKILSHIPKATLVYNDSDSDPLITSKNYGDGSGGEEYNGDRPRYSPLEFILSIPALRWAYYLILFTLLIFILFRMKRKQKAIPAKEKNENSTMEFAETVSQVYYQQGKHYNLVRHMERLFYGYIRDRYFMYTIKADEKFIRTLAVKSQIPEERIHSIFKAFEKAEKNPDLTDEQFIQLHQLTEYFYKNCK